MARRLSKSLQDQRASDDESVEFVRVDAAILLQEQHEFTDAAIRLQSFYRGRLCRRMLSAEQNEAVAVEHTRLAEIEVAINLASELSYEEQEMNDAGIFFHSIYPHKTFLLKNLLQPRACKQISAVFKFENIWNRIEKYA